MNEMELRHLRCFLAVAEAGSLTVAVAKKLNTSQLYLSRQIRDLENEVGVKLFRRGRRSNVELTAAGQTFLEHARNVLLQVDLATDAARRADTSTTATLLADFR